MKEFIEKLIKRLEELKELHAELIKDGLEEDYHSGCEGMCVDIIEIVNQLAEEYKPTTNSNIQEVIDNLEVYTVGRLKNARVHITVEELQNQIDRLEQLAEEYNGSNDSMEIQIAKNYSKWLTKCGVNVTEKWITATEQAYAPNEAYIRGRQDERYKFAEWQNEHKGGWIPCSERLPDDFMSFEYLTIRKGHTLATITYYCVANHKWYSNRNSTREIEVIAWQPLPAPYTEGE